MMGVSFEDLLSILGVVLGPVLGIYAVVLTNRQGKKAEEAREAADKAQEAAEQRVEAARVQSESLERARGYDDGVVQRLVADNERLHSDIQRLVTQQREREAYAVEEDQQHRKELADLNIRAQRAENRSHAADERAQLAEERARAAEERARRAENTVHELRREVAALRARLDAA